MHSRVNQVVLLQVFCHPFSNNAKEDLSFHIQRVYLAELIDV